ncbi:MAG: DUF1629 domain-containing protein [Ferruginibacter sp.]
MKSQFTYYIITSKVDENTPLLSEETNSPDYLYERNEIQNPKLILFKFGKPLPQRPILGDYLSSPNSVISKKIYDIIAPCKIDGIQLLPSRIRGLNNEIYSDYWAIHVFNRIKCIDLKASKCIYEDNMLDDIERLVLDEKCLDEIPMAKRLVFRLKEDRSFELYHSSLVDAIMSIKPSGIKFINIEEWNEESIFED